MNSYQQLAYEQRYQIYFMLDMEFNQMDIAKEMGAQRSTVNRELHRNKGRCRYRPKQEHRIALSRRNKAKSYLNPETWDWFERLTRQDGVLNRFRDG